MVFNLACVSGIGPAEVLLRLQQIGGDLQVFGRLQTSGSPSGMFFDIKPYMSLAGSFVHCAVNASPMSAGPAGPRIVAPWQALQFAS